MYKQRKIQIEMIVYIYVILYFIKKIDVRRVDELLQGGFDDCKS